MKRDYLLYLSVISCIIFFFPTLKIFSDPTDGFLDNEINFEEIYSDLPLNFDLESAAISELGSLPYFTNDSAGHVVSFRDSLGHGDSLSANLGSIPGLSPVQLAILNHLSQMKKASYFSGFSGYIRNGYAGKPGEEDFTDGKYYFKIHGESEKHIRFNLLGERDPFEPRALDLYSANLSIGFENARTYLVIGDYRPEIGQGLVFSRYSRNYINGTHIITSEKKTVENTMFEESLYLRGVFMKVRRGRFTAQFWTSFKNLDATLDENGNATNIKTTGYHYSGTARDNLSEQNNGASVSFNDRRGITLGLAGVLSSYSPALVRQSGERYVNYPEGSRFNYLSLNGKYKKDSLALFFEHALGIAGENATTGGLELHNGRVRSCMLLRNYSDGWWAPHSGGFSSFGNKSNEKGIYSALQTELPGNSMLLASMDVARTLSRTFYETMPLSRKRLSIMLRSRLRRGLTGRIVARSVDDSGDTKKRWNCRIHLEKKPGNAQILPGWRSQLAWSESEGRGGAYAEAALFSKRNKFTYDFSVGVFDIPSYNSRFYRYERDVPGRGLTRAVWGRGGTVLMVIRWGFLSARYRYADSSMFDTSHEFILQSDVVF